MTRPAVKLYVGLMCCTALAALALTDWAVVFGLPLPGLRGLLALAAISLISESLAIRLTVGKSAGNSSITFIPLLASVQLFGPAAAVLLMGVTGVLVEFFVRRNQLVRALFNSSQLILSTYVAGVAFALGKLCTGSHSSSVGVDRTRDHRLEGPLVPLPAPRTPWSGACPPPIGLTGHTSPPVASTCHAPDTGWPGRTGHRRELRSWPGLGIAPS